MMEFKAQITADHCQTTAKKRALSEECCSDFCLELCLLLPLLWLALQEQLQNKLPHVTEKSY
jgi:hypothetical protein